MSDQKRIEYAKRRFLDILKEMDNWLDEVVEAHLCAELGNFSMRAAELAAILGYSRPPFERIPVVPYEVYRAIPDIRYQAMRTRVRVSSPEGNSTFEFGFAGDLPGETLISEADSQLHRDLKSRVRRWRRAAERLDVSGTTPAKARLIKEGHSLEAEVFEEQRQREVAGDSTSVVDEIQEEVAEAYWIADLQGLTPRQRDELVAERARTLCHQTVDRRKALLLQDLDQRTDASEADRVATESFRASPEREPRHALQMRAETHVKDVCGGNFPGFRKLARALGCETRPASLKNAIKSSTYLRARKAIYDAHRQGRPTEQPLTEAHVDQIPQSTEPDPTLETLIREQTAEDRQDERMARTHARGRSR